MTFGKILNNDENVVSISSDCFHFFSKPKYIMNYGKTIINNDDNENKNTNTYNNNI